MTDSKVRGTPPPHLDQADCKQRTIYGRNISNRGQKFIGVHTLFQFAREEGISVYFGYRFANWSTTTPSLLLQGGCQARPSPKAKVTVDPSSSVTCTS